VSGGIDNAGVAVSAPDARVAIVAARWNAAYVDQMVAGALAELSARGVATDRVQVLRCPGAFELPSVARRAIDTGRFDAVICFGTVIRGDTAHFDFVAGECARGVAALGLEGRVPVIFGVLTTENAEQAEQRADPKRDNKGAEAALAALEMVALYRSLPGADA
jgi:6,7-dimethyl-8-ribityllumazine synthase